MTNTYKFTLLTAAATLALGMSPALADHHEAEMTAPHQKAKVKTTRIMTTKETKIKTANESFDPNAESESAVEYFSPNGGTLKADKSFASFDDNGNGSISSIEYKKHIPASSPTKFTDVDIDRNGKLNESEFNGVILEIDEYTETTVIEQIEEVDEIPADAVKESSEMVTEQTM